MALENIKADFHLLIEKIENEELLTSFYELLFRRSQAQDGQLWERLTAEEKTDLLLADEESKNLNNLLSDEEVRQKHQEWLKK